jgi:hypothetical protein
VCDKLQFVDVQPARGRRKIDKLKSVVLWLFEPVGDSSARQIVGRHFDTDAVAYQNAYAMFAHLAGNRREDDVRAVVQLHFEKGVGLLVDNCALRGD